MLFQAFFTDFPSAKHNIHVYTILFGADASAKLLMGALHPPLFLPERVPTLFTAEASPATLRGRFFASKPDAGIGVHGI